ncbi:MAG: ComEC family competence protein [Chloroflexi bacterium]|nr:MAG: ComEC family competence protein [Chloroflexota bacterium]
MAVAAGVWLASQFPMPLWLPALALGVSVLALLGAWRLRSAAEAIWLAAFGALVALGALRYTLSAPLPSPQSIARYNGQRVTLDGVIVAEPDVRPTHTNLRLRPWRVLGASGFDEALDDLVLIRIAAGTDATRWRYGDALRATGLLDAPPRMSAFDYREYLARQGVFSWMPQPRALARIGEGYGNPIVARLLDAKDAVRQAVRRILPRPEAALLNGVLIGDDKDIPDAVQEAFRRTGTSHIVAISGFNVSIVIALVIPLLGRMLNPRRAALFAIPAIAVYTVFVGASASVVRAATMAGIGLFGALFWRKGFTLNTLCAAACLMLVANPHTLFDVGFQLSFMATLGLVLYADRLSGPVRTWAQLRLRNERAQKAIMLILDGALVTLAAQLTTLPLILATYSQLSIISLPANILILPLQPPIMILGGLAAVIALFAPQTIGALAALPAHAFLTATIRIIAWLSEFEAAAISVYGFGPPAVLAYYIVLLALTAFALQPALARRAIADLLRARLKTTAILGIAGVALALGGVYWFQRPDGKLHAIFLGGSAIIQSPSGHQVVFAGGGGDVASTLDRIAPLWDREIELLIMPQRSEYTRRDALPLLQRYRVQTLVVPGGSEAEGDSLTEWQRVLVSSVGRVLTASIGTSFTLDADVSVVVEIRAPERGGSQVIGAQLIHHSVVIDLVGRYEAVGHPAQPDLIFLGPAKADVTKLNRARPRWVVWADTSGAPLAGLDPRIRAVSLRDVGQIAYTSDGVRLIVRR